MERLGVLIVMARLAVSVQEIFGIHLPKIMLSLLNIIKRFFFFFKRKSFLVKSLLNFGVIAVYNIGERFLPKFLLKLVRKDDIMLVTLSPWIVTRANHFSCWLC